MHYTECDLLHPSLNPPNWHSNMFSHNPMHNGYILPFDIVDYYLADLSCGISIPEEEEVATLEGRFHAAGEDDNDGGRGVGCYAEGFPEHKGCAEHEGEVEDLLEGLAGGGEGGSEVGEHGGGGYGGGWEGGDRRKCWLVVGGTSRERL